MIEQIEDRHFSLRFGSRSEYGHWPQAPSGQQLRIGGSLYRTLRSTNTIENLNGLIGTYTRNVKRGQGGSMILRWASAAVLDASKRFRRIRGYRDLDRLTRALESIEQEHRTATDQQVA